MNHKAKANGNIINQKFLNARVKIVEEKGFKKQRWVHFCEVMMAQGFECYLYEARHTVSKYVTIRKKGGGKGFKVRFSNHKPIKHKETSGDCDFFVGYTNLGIQTTEQAIAKTFEFFGVEVKQNESA